MKTLILSLLIAFTVLLSMNSQAQVPAFQWAKSAGGTGTFTSGTAKSVAVDAAGNVYSTGSFYGTVDFNPGAAVFNLTSVGSTSKNDIYILKLNSLGNFVWAVRMGGTEFDEAVSIALDASGNVYTTGRFFATIDFNPGAGVSNLTPVGDNDVFISKLDASGNFVWAKQMGGLASDFATSIAVDASGNVYTTGGFSGTADFNPGAGTFNLTAGTNAEMFISKLDAAGNFIWAKQSLAGTAFASTTGSSIAVDASGNVYTTGYFTETVDFDPGAGVFNLTSAGTDDIFVLKSDASGNFTWVKRMGGTSVDEGFSIAVDVSGNVYTTGYFYLTADFDPGPGIFNLSVGSVQDMFVSKLDASGNFVWAKSFKGNSYDFAYRIAVDASGYVYTTGSFIGTTDFDPGPGQYKLTSKGIKDVFILKLDPTGNYYWAVQMGGTSVETANDLALDASGNVYTTGFFQGIGDYDPGAAVFNLTPLGNSDIFISKLSQPVLPLPPVVTAFTPANGYTGTAVTIAGSYFAGITAVKIGGVNAASFTNNTIFITAIVGAGNTGPISVTNQYGTTVSAASFTYDGYVTADNGNWSNPATWLGGNVPPAGASVTINNDVLMDMNVTVNSGNNIIVHTTLYMGTNTISGAGTFTLADYASIASANAAGISGNISTAIINLSPNAGYIFNGSGIISTTGLPATVNRLTINTTGPGTIQLNNDVTVTQELVLTNGTVTTAANKLIMDSYGYITGSNSGSYINGNLQRGINAGSPTMNFPIGDATIYRPVTINFNNVPDGKLLASVSATAADHPSISSAALDPNRSVNRYWTLTDVDHTFTSGTYDASFEFTAGDKDALVNDANLKIGKYSAGIWTYPTTIVIDALHVSAIAINGFSDFVIAEPASLCNTTGSGTTTPTTCGNSSNGTATITLSASTSGTYIVDGAASQSYITNPFTVTGLPAGNHTIVATSTGGCVSADISVVVGGSATFLATYIKTNLGQCSAVPNGTITVTATGGTAPYTYIWTGESGSNHTTFLAGNTSSLSGLNYGYYTVTITDAGGCGIVLLSGIHIEIGYQVTISNSGSVSGTCSSTGSLVFFGNSGLTPYTWSLTSAAGPFQASNTFTGLAAGSYTVWVKDNAGCIASKSVTVNAAPAIVPSAFVTNAGNCTIDGTIQIFRSGGIPPYTYSITSAAGPFQVNNSFTGLAAGLYTAYVKDAAGCVGQQGVTVAQGAALAVTASKINTSTCTNDGTIQVNVSAGVAPYTYSKDNGATYQPGNSFTLLAAGNYPVTVKDFKNCTGTLNVSIALNPILVTSYAVSASSCAATNGSIQLFRTGGAGPYTYSLDGNTYQASTSFSNKAPGTYTGFVKDSKACLGILTGIIVGPNCPPVFTFNAGTTISKNSQANVPVNNGIKIQLYPNPGKSAFTLLLQGFNSNEKIFVSVTDFLGRKVYQTEGTGKQQYKFGNNFIPGMYNVEVTQGINKQQIKLIKE